MADKYVPTLKAREAEIKALLASPRSLDITPLFELQPASLAQVDPTTGLQKRSKGTATDASYFLDDVARLWDGPLYVDISRIAQVNERAQWWRLLAALNSVAKPPLELIPVVALADTMLTMHAAADAARTSGRLGLRIPMHAMRGGASAITGTVTALATEAAIPEGSVDVILDWSDTLETTQLDQLELETRRAIAAIGQCGELVTIGTPNSGSFVQVGDWTVKRREWWLWLRLRSAGINVTYGDYALYPPSDPVPVSPRYGHLRYSSEDRLHVHRRAVPSSGGGLGGAFEACCKHLTGSTHWMGSTFSRADQRFSDIAARADKESQPGKWRQLATEHHFSLVARQLASPPPPPPPGTL
ncbi:hypothetical protein DNL40_04460 [Xylanimonas oleitrophica]|uniref:Beta protein n=1 Tax=Xylanimonas oleitrophica TaxID=2607479 RepID=A0A2W5XUY8_9MICO|nr:hypothetical protein [Xylanimonas oleitrophica]PZR54188.1 hypothetical protein DNL40_04460 [Xylanimonas oleitrophica]